MNRFFTRFVVMVNAGEWRHLSGLISEQGNLMQVHGPVRFREVMPSAMLVLLMGGILSIFISPWQWLGSLSWLAWPMGVGLGSLIYLMSFVFSRLQWSRTRSVRQLLASPNLLFKNFTWPQIIIVSLLAGVGEELLIRGVLQSFLVDSLGAFWGIILASLVFGLLHYMTKTYVVLTFVLGMMFGIAFHLSNSMILVMIGHAVYDIFAFAMIVKYPQILGIDTIKASTNISETVPD